MREIQKTILYNDVYRIIEQGRQMAYAVVNNSMHDELIRTEGDNPTIGIVLCSETSKDIARYSILKGNEQLFAAKYKTYLPTEEQLRTEIERQKELFKLQHELKMEGKV